MTVASPAFDTDQAIQDFFGMMVVGPGGCGKTTFVAGMAPVLFPNRTHKKDLIVLDGDAMIAEDPKIVDLMAERKVESIDLLVPDPSNKDYVPLGQAYLDAENRVMDSLVVTMQQLRDSCDGDPSKIRKLPFYMVSTTGSWPRINAKTRKALRKLFFILYLRPDVHRHLQNHEPDDIDALYEIWRKHRRSLIFMDELENPNPGVEIDDSELKGRHRKEMLERLVIFEAESDIPFKYPIEVRFNPGVVFTGDAADHIRQMSERVRKPLIY